MSQQRVRIAFFMCMSNWKQLNNSPPCLLRDQRPVAAIVYQHGNHFIHLFIGPASRRTIDLNVRSDRGNRLIQSRAFMKLRAGQIVKRQTKQRSPEKNRMPRLHTIDKGQLALQLFLEGAELGPQTIRGPLRVQCSGRGDPNPLRRIIQEVLALR